MEAGFSAGLAPGVTAAFSRFRAPRERDPTASAWSKLGVRRTPERLSLSEAELSPGTPCTTATACVQLRVLPPPGGHGWRQEPRLPALHGDSQQGTVMRGLTLLGVSFRKEPQHPELRAIAQSGACWALGATYIPVCAQNVTNTVVRTMLRNDLSPEGIIHHLKILSPIHCAFQNDLLTSSGYAPEWG